MNILHIKDPHTRIGLKAPISRDQKEFEEDIENKLQQIEDICKKEKVDAITFSGDIFDVKREAVYTHKIKDLNYKRFLKLRNATRKKKIYSIAGNHDLPYSSREFKDQSIYVWMVRSGVFEDVHNKIIDLGEGIKLCGLDYNKNLGDLDREIKELNSKLDPKYTNLLLFHEHLLPHEDFNGNPFLGSKMGYKKVLKRYPNITVFLAGHYHKGYPVYKEKGRFIVNGWSLFRLARDYYTVNKFHVPEVNIIKIKNNVVKVKTIQLQVRSFDEAIKSERLEKELEGNLNLTSFMEKVKETKLEEDIIEKDLTETQKTILNEIMEGLK